MSDKPNIVLICVDQWRADCLSIAGHPVVETPHLDGLADGGVRFTQAFSAVPSCIAARAALFTGLSQRAHGRVGYQDAVEWRYPVTLAGELARGGYQTAAVGKMHVHPQRNAMGFQKVVLHDGMLHYYGRDRQSDYEDWLRKTAGSDCGLFDHGLAANSWVSRPWHLAEQTHPTYWATSRAVDFLYSRDAAKPFFLFLSYVAPHPPLVPPRFYLDQYLQQDMPAPPVGDWVHKLGVDIDAGRWNPNCFFGRLDGRAQRRAQAGYYGLMTQIDHQIGRLIEHMSDLRLLHNTIFIFVSDHGEMLGDHHLFRKQLPYLGSANVPLLMSFPAGMGIARRQTPHHAVELRDIMPTLLDAAGLAVPEGVEGRSVLPLLRDPAAPWRPYIHGEHSGSREWSNHWIADGRYKYIWYSQTGVEQLFDTQSDPTELHDLAESASCRNTLQQMRRHLVTELTGREEGYTDGQRLITARPPKATLSHIVKP